VIAPVLGDQLAVEIHTHAVVGDCSEAIFTSLVRDELAGPTCRKVIAGNARRRI
jgi:hypothetical protein